MRISLKGVIYPLIAVGAVAGSPAYALPAIGYERIYYSDATMSQEVGMRVLTCNGTRDAWGVVTPYMWELTEKCTNIGCGLGFPCS